MFREIKPPTPLQEIGAGPSVFLAGSIDMGAAKDWQSSIAEALAGADVTILNPRRDAWDASWEQSISNPEFRGQVEWELAAQEKADVIAMYFDPQTKAPITLLELGLFANSGTVVVCCPDGFWRKGNIEIVCAKYGIEMVETLDALVAETRSRLSH